MTSFGAVNYSNCTNREKDESNYHFSLIVKDNSKKGLKPSKVNREKQFASLNFSERFNLERKLERTRIKIMPSASPS